MGGRTRGFFVALPDERCSGALPDGGLWVGFFLWCLLRASLELRNAEQALQGDAGGGRGTSTVGVASSVGERRMEEVALVLALVVVLSEGTPEADEASSFPSMVSFLVASAGAGAAFGCARQAANENPGTPPEN